MYVVVAGAYPAGTVIDGRGFCSEVMVERPTACGSSGADLPGRDSEQMNVDVRFPLAQLCRRGISSSACSHFVFRTNLTISTKNASSKNIPLSCRVLRES